MVTPQQEELEHDAADLDAGPSTEELRQRVHEMQQVVLKLRAKIAALEIRLAKQEAEWLAGHDGTKH